MSIFPKNGPIARIHPEYLLLALGVGLFQMRLVTLLFGKQYQLSVDAAAGVVSGTPHWRVFQNRVLGPNIIDWASRYFDSFYQAHVAFTAAMFVACAYLALLCLHRSLGDRPRTLAAFFAFVALASFCFQRPWLYPWDLLELAFFLVFNQLVVEGRKWPAFAALFAVAIWNRESAMAIALWMVGDPLCRRLVSHLRREPFEPLDKTQMAVGIALLVFGRWLVEYLRTSLLVREVGFDMFGPVPGAGPSFHYMLPDNLQAVRASLTDLTPHMGFLVPVFIVAYAAFAALVAKRDPKRYLGVALVHLVLLGSTLVVALVFETRVFLGFVPFVALHLWTVLGDNRRFC